MAMPLVVWDRAMLGYDMGAEHPMNPLRLDLTIQLATELGVLDGVQFHLPEPADDETLRTVHTVDYIEAVKKASLPDAAAYLDLEDLSHGLGTPDDPVFEGMHEVSALIAGGSVQGARAIATGRVDRAVNIAGGLHHAMPDRASGFCVYNDAALAIRELLSQGVRKVAYVDIDVHHGDGVQAVFYDDPRVLTISIHESPLTLWPGTGWAAECGQGAAAGTSVNIPIPAGTRDAGWLRAFHAVIPSVLREFRPDVLLTQHGADSHAEDPLADLLLSVDGQRAAAIALRSLAEQFSGGRWLAMGGGGYSLVRVVPRSWTHLLATVLDRDVDPATPLPPGFRAVAGRYLPDNGTLRGALPAEMGDGQSPAFKPWQGEHETPLDKAILETRRVIFPLHGLDPFDPRD